MTSKKEKGGDELLIPVTVVERDPRVPASFGQYLAELRAQRSLSLREAAAEIGLSFGYLRKLETSERVARPSLLLLQQIAAGYGVPSSEVLRAAGITSDELRDPKGEVDRMFRRLVLHKRLRPRGMDAKHWIDSFSHRQKLQWIEFAQRLEARVLNENDADDRDVLEILRGVPMRAPDDGEE